ncbi:conjugative transfer relaxase/helicase TraI [Piscirickettsia salmonis]|nr:conjugative transfer relaxase/helicase TraI [Piscirickettsia salmonis]
MSIGIVSSSMDLAKYFTDKDNYYLTDKSDLKKAAVWMGKGAEILGLEGKTVDAYDFTRLVSGKMPDDQQLGVIRDGQIKHRPATDLTFSPPKSFSIMALVAGDERLIEGHNRAVEKVLAKVEKMYAEARVTKDGVVSYEKTGNAVIAAFRHTSSREKDPDLHTHGVILNMTQREDGKWRAMSSRSKGDVTNINHGFREQIYANQHYLGMIYNSEIAKASVECNYGIRVVDQYGNFEIEGVPEEYIKSQSKRRGQILDELDKRGEKGARAAQKATLFTRERKESISPDQLKSQWKKEAKEFGVNLEQIYQDSLSGHKTQNTIQTKLPPLSKDATSAIEDAVGHLSQYSVQLRHGDIIRQAFTFSAGVIEHEALEQVIEGKLKSGELVGKEQEYYTTKALLDTENNLSQKVSLGVNTGFSRDVGHSGLGAETLKRPDRLQIIDVKGLKNEAKLINELVKTAENQNLNTYVLHSNQSRINHLNNSIHRDSSSLWQSLKNHFKHDLLQTVGKFQHDYKHKLGHSFFDKKQDYIVVTDAQKLSYQDIDKLNDLSEAGKAKIIFLNNTESMKGFTPGNGIKLMKEAGIHSYRSQTLRKGTFIEVAETQKTQQALARASLKNKEAAIVAFTNKAQHALTEEIRGLKQGEGELSLQELKFNTLSTRGLSDVEKTKVKNYHVGDQITLNPFSKEQKIYFIQAIDKKAQTLKLIDRHESTHSLSINEKTDFQVNKQQTLAIAKGEQLRLTRNLYLDKHTTLEKDCVIQVESMNDKGIRIRDEKHTHWIPKEKLEKSFVDYGYVVKPHQLKETEHAMTALAGYQVNQNNLGEISEFAKKVTLFTDHAEKSKKSLNEQGVSWVAKEITEGAPEKHYKHVVRTEQAIRADLETVAKSLSNNDLDKVKTAVSYGIAKLAEREAGFKFSDLCAESVKYAIGEVTMDEVEKVIEEKAASGELLIQEQMITTPQAYGLEKKIIQTNLAGQNKVDPIFKELPALDEKLTQGQKDAVTLALTTKDRFIGVQGLAGTGKTTMMKEFRKHAEAQGYRIVGIAPTHKAVQKLDESINEGTAHDLKSAGIPVMTAHSFLGESLEGYDEKTIFITDEVSMMSNRLYSEVQDKVNELQGRNIFTGDIGQEASIESGKPQELSMEYGLKYAVMNEIVRQKQSSDMLKAAELAAAKRPSESLRTVEKMNPENFIKRSKPMLENTTSFIELPAQYDDNGKKIESVNPVCEAIATDYLTRISEQRDKTIVIASRHKHREIIDNEIRKGLLKEGVIKNEIETTRYRSLNLDQADMLHASNYQKGMIIKFNRTFSIAKKGDHMSVTGMDTEKNIVKLKDQNGQEYSINPAKISMKAEMSAYEELKVKLGEGDKVRLRTTNKNKGWLGGAEYAIKEINHNKVLLENDSGALVIDHKDPEQKHWDYAYTNTTFSVQGDGAPYVIGLAINESYRSNYIQLTRPYLHANIYTDNKEKLINFLNNADAQKEADKISAYEIMHDSKHKEKLKQPENKHSLNLTEEIRPLLNQRIEELAITLLGEPNKALSSKTSLRFGEKGSMVINTETAKWYSHEEGKGGGSFDLIQREMGFTHFKDSLDFGKKFLNYSPDIIKSESKNKEPILSIKQEEKTEKLKQYAQTLYNKSKPIKGTLSEKYLVEHRQIIQTNHSNLRYLPSIPGYKNNKKVYTPALLAIAKNSKGEVNHAQVIRLDKDGSKNNDVSINKQIYGKTNGLPIELNDKADRSVSYLFKGVETALSSLNINKEAHVMALLSKSNLVNVDLKKLANKVVLCLDNDGVKTLTDRTIKKAIHRLVDAGKEVRIVMPEKDKTDFNDVLRKEGYSELSKQFNTTLSPQKFNEISIERLANHSIKIDKINQKIELKSVKSNHQDSFNFDLKVLKFPKEDRTIYVKKDQQSYKEMTKEIRKDDMRLSKLNKESERKFNEQIKNDQIENITPSINKKVKGAEKEMGL